MKKKKKTVKRRQQRGSEIKKDMQKNDTQKPRVNCEVLMKIFGNVTQINGLLLHT